ncbi:hypothetical protein LCGC14_2355650 [marine sediment metagenome]|uniref:Uncharacterized protein n=1 Tax=marine sediment metagenome TaxID=412755 RepID=A0A0F9F2X1_9ZZZZ
MQVSIDQLFSQIGRLQVEKTALEQANATLAQEVVNLRKRLERYEGQGEGKQEELRGSLVEEPKKPLEFPGPEKPE